MECMQLEKIRKTQTMQAVLSDSFGGVMYNVANKEKYNTTLVLSIWDSMTPAEQASADGIIKGAINFLKND